MSCIVFFIIIIIIISTFFFFLSMRWRLYEQELLDHNKQLQRTPVPKAKLLRSTQGVRLPFQRQSQWFVQRLCSNHVQLHQPVRQIPTRTVRQFMPRGANGSCLRCFTPWESCYPPPYPSCFPLPHLCFPCRFPSLPLNVHEMRILSLFELYILTTSAYLLFCKLLLII